MKKNLSIILAASVFGVIGGLIGGNTVNPAYAASNVIVTTSEKEMVAKCDFSKTIVIGVNVGGKGGYACVQR